jgi:hypothetical protein
VGAGVGSGSGDGASCEGSRDATDGAGQDSSQARLSHVGAARVEIRQEKQRGD